MTKSLLAAVGILALSIPATAQTKAKKAETGFKKTATGLEYKIEKDAPGTQTAHVGDFVELHIRTTVGDSVLYDSRKFNGNKPVPFQVPPSQFKGDLPEAFELLSAGDSAIVNVPLDSMLVRGAQPLPWMKKGAGMKMTYYMSIVSVKNAEQMRKEQEISQAAQKATDEKLLLEYFAKNNIKATKTASGLYYVISNPGSGEKAQAGKTITVNYTGKTMDGQPFDSNIDPQFQHVQPFEFGLGQGQVIKGWDEGLALLNKGGKGTLYIPSGLAYGAQSPSPKIPANSILIFDVELVDIK